MIIHGGLDTDDQVLNDAWIYQPGMNIMPSVLSLISELEMVIPEYPNSRR